MAVSGKTKKELIEEISALRTRLEELERSEVKYLSLMANIPDVVWTSDEKGNTTFISENVKDIYGYSPEEIYARGDNLWFGRIHSDDMGNVKASYKAVFEVSKQLDIEYRVRRKDGRWIWIRDRSFGAYEKDGMKYADGVFSDITERKKTREELRKSKAFLDNVINTLDDPFFVKDQEHRWFMLNDSACKVMGRPREELIGKSDYDLFPREQADVFWEKDNLVLETGKTDINEEKITWHGKIHTISTKKSLYADSVTSKKFVTGTIRDITELRRSEESLRESEGKLEAMLGSLAEHMSMLDKDLNIIWANETAMNIFGDDIVGRKCYEAYHQRNKPCEPYPCLTLKAFQDGKVHEQDAQVVDKDGNTKYFHCIANVTLRDEQGEPTAVLEISEDVTERKKAEEQIRKFKTLADRAGYGVGISDLDGYVMYVNSSFLEMHGYKANEFFGKNLSLFHNEEQMKNVNRINDKLRKEGTYVAEEVWHTRKDGSVFPTLMNGTLICDENGKPLFFGVTALDITASKKTEQELRIKENAIASSINAIAIAEFAGNLTYVNKSFLQMWGYDDENEVLGKPTVEFWQHKEKAKEIIEALYCGDSVIGELVARRQDGSLFDIQLSASMVADETGAPVFMMGSFMDITERKRSEEKLRQSEERFKVLFESAPDAYYIHDLEGNFIDGNKAVEQLLGYNREEVIKKNFFKLELFAEKDLPQIRAALSYNKDGKPTGPLELTLYRKDGSKVMVETRSYPVEIGGQTVVLGIARDITERKRLEEAYHSLVDNSLQGLTIIQDGRMVFINKAFSSTTGYSEQELLDASAEQIRSLVHPEDRELVWKRHRDRLAGKPLPPRYEFRWIRKDGSTCWVEIHASEIEYQGSPAIQAAYIDITERKKAEQALRQSEERLKILFEFAPDAIYLNDLKGNFVDGNKAAEEILGYARDELIGKSFVETVLLSSEQMLKAVANLKKNSMGKPTGPDEFILTRKDGSSVSVETRSFPVRIKDRYLSLSIAHDISARKKAERKIFEHRAQLKSLASELSLTEERERHRLATDLHDQISQALVISRIKLQQLHASVSSAEIAGPLAEACENLDRIIQDTRTLTFDLSSPILYELGFEAAVSEWLEEQVGKKHGIKTQFEDDGRPKPLQDDIRILLFRNVRELLINVVKHADAQNVKVSISRIRQQICVSVEDDGIGFNPAELASKAGFGIFSIHERLEQLTGHIEIESEPGRGTKITMMAPLKIDKKSRQDEIET